MLQSGTEKCIFAFLSLFFKINLLFRIYWFHVAFASKLITKTDEKKKVKKKVVLISLFVTPQYTVSLHFKACQPVLTHFFCKYTPLYQRP